MNTYELTAQQRLKEGKALKTFLLCGVTGSVIIHALILTMRVGGQITEVMESPLEAVEQEVVVEAIADLPVPPEFTVPDAVPPAPAEGSTSVEAPVDGFVAPDILASPAIADHSNPSPILQEAPVPVAASPVLSSAPSSPAPSSAALLSPEPKSDVELPQPATGPITRPAASGQSFGAVGQVSGFAPQPQPAGRSPSLQPDLQPGSQLGQPSSPSSPGSSLGVPTAIVNPRPQPAKPQPVCVSCPKPVYRGREGSPRVEMMIQPDGRVRVMLRQSSGNPEVDREVLETMSQWRFDPQTVPTGGLQRRVRVTFEEEGSAFQREAQLRRQRETEQRQLQQLPQLQASPTTTGPVSSPASPAASPQPSPSGSPAIEPPAVGSAPGKMNPAVLNSDPANSGTASPLTPARPALPAVTSETPPTPASSSAPSPVQNAAPDVAPVEATTTEPPRP